MEMNNCSHVLKEAKLLEANNKRNQQRVMKIFASALSFTRQ
jgi:hypothetical protein